MIGLKKFNLYYANYYDFELKTFEIYFAEKMNNDSSINYKIADEYNSMEMQDLKDFIYSTKYFTVKKIRRCGLEGGMNSLCYILGLYFQITDEFETKLSKVPKTSILHKLFSNKDSNSDSTELLEKFISKVFNITLLDKKQQIY